MPDSPLDKLKQKLKEEEDNFAGIDKNDPAMHQIIKKNQETIDRLKYEIQQEEGLAKKAASPIQYNQGKPSSIKNKIPKIGLSAKEVEEIRNRLRKESGLGPLGNKPKTEEKSKLSPQDKKIIKAVKDLSVPAQRRYTPGSFNLPQFTTDNSTGIVLACILIIFFIELHGGTKFVALWNDAFSPSSTKSNSTPSANQDHSNITKLGTAIDTAQDTSELNKSVGGGMYDYFEVPNSFGYLEGVMW